MLVSVGVTVRVPNIPLVVRRVRLLGPLVHGLRDGDPHRLPDGRHVAVGQRHDRGRDWRGEDGGVVVHDGRRGRRGHLRCWWWGWVVLLLRGGVLVVVYGDFLVPGVVGGDGDGG